MKPKVYLAGPIFQTSYDECTSWREEAKLALEEVGIEVYSPMRAKQYLSNVSLVGDTHPEYQLSTGKGIVNRDRFDVMRSDIILMNVLGARRVSIGTCIEIGWSDAYRKPIVLVIEPEKSIHEHGMIRELIGWRVPTLIEGIEIVKAILLS